MLQKFVLAFAISLFSASACADASTFCFYELLIESHAAVSRCGDRPDAASESRYRQLLAAVRKNIIESAHLMNKSAADTKASLDKHEADLQVRTLADKGAICKSPDYSDERKVLENLIKPKTLPVLLKGLSIQKNPEEGECISLMLRSPLSA
jgi:hypothetical protein